MSRSYVADLPGGTATTTVQIQQRQTFKWAAFSVTNAAAGKIELSTAPSSQIGTAQPTDSVVCRINVSGTAGPSQNVVMPVSMPVQPFQSVYIHQTGAGNLGNVTLY
jgi:hypothetical protein